MNKILLLITCVAFLSACSQKQFAFRQKVRADKHEPEKNELARSHKEVSPNKKAELQALKQPGADSAATTAENIEPNPVSPKAKKPLLSASALKEIIPFTLDQLSHEEQELIPESRKPLNSGGGDALGYISMVLGILSIVALLSLVFISSNMLGVIVLFLAPLLGAIALILGVVSISNHEGHGVGWAGVVMGSFILLVTLIMVLIAYLFIQSSLT